VHIVIAGTVGQHVFINKKRWENKKNVKTRFVILNLKNVKKRFIHLGL